MDKIKVAILLSVFCLVIGLYKCSAQQGGMFIDSLSLTKITKELLEFDVLKDKYSLLEQENIVLKEKADNLQVHYDELAVDLTTSLGKLNKANQRADKRIKRTAMIVGGITGFVGGTIYNGNRKYYVGGELIDERIPGASWIGAGLGIGVGWLVHYSIGFIL